MEGARRLGYTFTTRTPRTVSVEVHGQLLQFDVLNVLEFTSTRKRMSVSGPRHRRAETKAERVTTANESYSFFFSFALTLLVMTRCSFRCEVEGKFGKMPVGYICLHTAEDGRLRNAPAFRHRWPYNLGVAAGQSPSHYNEVPCGHLSGSHRTGPEDMASIGHAVVMVVNNGRFTKCGELF